MKRENNKGMGLLHDKNGRIVLWQKPNSPLIGWAIFFGVSFMTGDNYLASSLRNISIFLLLSWVFIEFIKGVGYMRLLAAVMCRLSPQNFFAYIK
jgi:hypothetical protein